MAPPHPPVPGNAVATAGRRGIAEPAYSRRQALGTGAFWLLLLYTVLVYPVQAGVSLHQAPFLIERGIDPTIAATIVSTFSLTSALATLACGALPRAAPIRYPLAATGAILTLGVLLLLGVETAFEGYIAAGVFGFGIGAILTLLPIAWADYFGRAHFGAIRGIALPAQVLAQAVGPRVLGRTARPDRQLHGLAAMLPGAGGSERRRGPGRPAAESRSGGAPRGVGPKVLIQSG